jgi:peptide/nickel transport system substrate-binding protein
MMMSRTLVLLPATRIVLAVLVAIAAWGISSCSGAREPMPEIPTWTSDINSRDPGGLRDGGDLRLPLTDFPVTLNAMHANAYTDTWPLTQATSPRAFKVEQDGVAVVDKDYFTDVELTSVNPQEVTYTINPHAVWTDGTPITWRDIASQVYALSGEDKAFTANTTSGYSQATVTRGVDDRQAVITFKKPYPEWRGMFSGGETLLPQSITSTPGAFNASAMEIPSAGPFMVERVDQEAKQIVLTRNPRWWGRPARLNSVTFGTIAAEDQMDALQNGDIDAMRLTNAYDLASARLLDGVAVRHAREMRWTLLGFGGAPGNVLADSELRIAISQGVDREAIVNILQRGMTDYPTPPNSHVYAEGQRGHRDNVVECECLSTTYDPDNAARQLDDMGWKLNGDVRQKDGKSLILNDVFPDTRDDWDLATLLRDQLAEIGVKVNLVNPDAPYFVEGNFDLTHYEIVGDGFPLKGLYDLYGSKGMFNGGRIGSQEVDDAIEAAVTEADEQRAQELANEVDVDLWREVHSAPLSQSLGFVAVRSDLANYGAFGTASIDFTAVGFTG